MDIRIEPSRLSGNIAAIPSKSYAHRILTACALSDKPTEVQISVISDDIRSAIQALAALGADIIIKQDSIVVSPIKPVAYPNINCGESGTIARFLLPVATALYENGTITGEGSLHNRPFKVLCDVLEKNGCQFDTKKLPISFKGKIDFGKYEIIGNECSQYISGLLFALPMLNGDSRIILTTPLESSGYVDMTLHVLMMFGIEVCCRHGLYEIRGRQCYKSANSITVEGDWSNAAFWLAADVDVTGLNQKSLQKDKLFLTVKNESEIDASDTPDLVPILSVMAAVKSNITRIYNIKRLRLKESDRIKSTVDMLTSLGCETVANDNEIVIVGCGKLRGGMVNGANDHRIVMAAAIASCFCEEPVNIIGAHAVNKTYPDFFKDFNILGGKAVVI